MPDLERSALIAGAVVAALGLVYARSARSKRQQQFPPGPPGVPVLGNALQIPPEHAWLKFSEWQEQYGDVIHLTALGRHILILNSQEAVDDLLIKRGNIYSSRPHLPMCELSGWKDCVGLLPYGERLRITRKMCNQLFGQRECRRYVPLQEWMSIRFLQRMHTRPDPASLDPNTRWFAAATTLKLVYGYDVVDEGEDPLVKINDEANNTFTWAASPGWMVDLIPSLRHLPEWFPGAGFLRQAREWKKLVDSMYDVPLAMVKRAMAEGSESSQCAMAYILAGEDGNGVSELEEDIARLAMGGLYGAAGETTATTLVSFYLAMVLHPECQRHAREEIDAVTGGDRLPMLEDRPALPYVDAIVKEVHRWNPVVAGGLAHCTSDEDTYRGWRIPAGTIVMPNIWKLTHDPAVYPEPSEFKPDRYFDPRNTKAGLNPDPKNFIFGFGRRECPGRHLADGSTWLGIAQSLATFDIRPAKDANGREIIPVPKYTGGVLTRPNDFQFAIEPRSERAKVWLESERPRPAL